MKYQIGDSDHLSSHGSAFIVGRWHVNSSQNKINGRCPIFNPFESVPTEFAIVKIYPNPFNLTATIKFSLARESKVIMTVYDLLGREVVKILNQHLDAGHHNVEWNAGNIPSGIYFVSMQAGGFSRTQKVTVLR